MPPGWRQVTRGASQAHVTQMEGFALFVLGGSGEWWWLVRFGDYDLAESEERTLTAAKVAAEDAARGLVDDPQAGTM
jgi:hypothetical protein